MELEQLKYDLKKMIIEDCEKEDVTPEDIPDDVEIFSSKSGLDLDSLDALEISMGLQKNYGIRLGDPKAFRRTVTSIEALAHYIIKQRHG
jgi:acyl carrier protein